MVKKAQPLEVTRGKPIGNITRGTTNPNRLRRVDRYIAALPVLRSVEQPIVVDLGYGASPITAIELLQRVSKSNPNAHVLGIEIDRERVERGLEVAGDRLHFALGGFEVPMPAEFAPGRPVDIIRCFNVLRQYDESDVQQAWARMQSRLTEDGLLVEGTCDEIGRVASWVTLNKTEVESLTMRAREAGIANFEITGFLTDNQFRDYLLAVDLGLQLRISPLLKEKLSETEKSDTPLFVRGQDMRARTDLDMVVEGEAELRRPGLSISADRVDFQQTSNELEATGHVRISRDISRFEGPHLKLQLDSFRGQFESSSGRSASRSSRCWRPGSRWAWRSSSARPSARGRA